MSNNVTPLRPAAPPPATPPPKKRTHRAKPALSFSDPPDEPSSLRVFQALKGTCCAGETASENGHDELAMQLATAATILSEILNERML